MSRSPKETVIWLSKPFERMKNLKILIVQDVIFCQELKYYPIALQMLEWRKLHFSEPSKYCPQELVTLNMSWSSRIGMEKIFKQV